MRLRASLVFLMSLVLSDNLFGSVASARNATPVPGVDICGPDEMVGWASLGEWSGRWWQWAVSIPMEINSNVDPTGGSCTCGQSGPVFFLPGAFQTSRRTT